MTDQNHSLPQTAIVGIGASAGGLDALKQFFSCTRDDSGLAYVVVVHLTPEHPSMLADLLQPLVSMPVQQVTEDLPVEPNNVYVIPPGSNLSTIDSHLRLSKIEQLRRERAPIDHFFDTLAETHGEHAVAVVLSGTGSDGSIGITMVKERGGLTIAQDPDEAGFDGMPRSAIASGLVDLVLPAKEMPGHIRRFIETSPRVEIAEDLAGQAKHDRQLLQQIFAQVRARGGQDFSRYKPSTVLRRIRRRMQLHHKEHLSDYLKLLQEDRGEVHQLADELLITVTQFFRDAETFAHIEKEVIPQLFAGKGTGDRIRVWSVGCATGEEAYSLAILLLEEAGRVEEPPEIEVFASDLHDNSLGRAREGLYPDTIEGYVSPERLRRFFVKEDSVYRVRKEVREIVVFATHNLLKDPPFSRLDLIVCRNLLIYLQRDTQDKVVELFHYALKPGGLLWLGSAETIDRTALFEAESKGHCLYRRRNVPAPEPGLPVFPQTMRVRPLADQESQRSEPIPSYGALHQRSVERWALPSILVDQDYRIVHISEHAGRYLRVPGGEPSANIFKLVREELRIELRAALHAALEHGTPQRTAALDLELEGQPRQVVMHARPSQERELAGLCLIIFDEMDAATAAPSAEPASARDSAELERTRERLRTVIEQYETSQEEMKAANEELQSTNEELRSTLEELETSKEELQSMNEELQTVNQENRHKVDELSQLTADLNNLMAASDIATLFLDRELRILRVTPKAGRLFHIRTQDRGRPLSDLRRLVAYEQLEEDAHSVLATLVPVQREVKGDGEEWYLTRVLPYRSTSDQIQGVVMTLVEVTDLKRAELATRKSEARFRALVTASSYSIYRMSPDWREMRELKGGGFIVDTNQPSRDWLDKYIDPEDQPMVLAAIDEAIREKRMFELEHRVRRIDGGLAWTLSRAVPLLDEQGEITEWFGAAGDVTARREMEEALREEHRRKDEFLATLGHELRNPLAPLRTGLELLAGLLPDDPELKRVREMLERHVQHLGRLVDDLLDVARIKSGHISLQRHRLDLRDLVRDAVGDLRGPAEAAGLTLTAEHAAQPLPVEGDAVRLVQMITNLLNNAIKYTPAGGRIQVTSRSEGSDGVVSIRDSGIGLAPDQLTRIFDLFAQGPRNPAHASSGLGLGLTLARRLAELHGGSLDADSDGVGKGSEFILRLPLARNEPPAIAPAAAQADGDNTGEPRRVLIVDDMPDIVYSLSPALQLRGHEVRQADRGEQALAIADDFEPEVVILDIGLPDMDGYTLARRLREHPATSEALLIAVSGYGQDEDRDKSRAAGIDHHLAKPADLKELEALIG